MSTTAPVTAMSIDTEEEDDWEYEYSATETEMQLISLDLSLPEFVRRRDDMVVHNTRGGFRSWLNPINLGAGKQRRKRLGDEPDIEADADADDGELAEDSDNHGKTPGKTPGQQQPRQQPEEPDPTEIQVLELHDAEPLVSYRGMLFKGSWSQIIGTEMLFADKSTDGAKDAKDAKDAYPRLAVAPGVDLVGATAARIACTPVELRPRDGVGSSAGKRFAKAKSVSAGGKGSLSFVIPVGNAASVPRQQQAHFLEQLMALKHEHGETDVVTVQALETKQNAVHGDADEAKRRARRDTLVQVHQERRARRLREAAAAAGSTRTGTGASSGTLAAAPPRRRRRRRELSPLATVAGDDELAGIVMRNASDSQGAGADARQRQDESYVGSDGESGSEA
ncbi:hypothetical protein SEPCBS119000_003117 [Sporothrix epigloea]|uniref:Transcription factor TFIIIC triple barrel domain-containing protein n=1 Tax=Sporothrix epigloea TaxID=1892477 RepID=A0ABP0DNC7_9PEZI